MTEQEKKELLDELVLGRIGKSLPGCHFRNHIRRTKWDIVN